MESSRNLVIIVCIITVIIVLFNELYMRQRRKEYEEECENKPKPEPDPKRPLSLAEKEAFRQAQEAYDYDAQVAIFNRTYSGPLPEYDGVYWSNIYPNIYHTKIAGINFRKGLNSLAGTYFDAMLYADPKNEYDPNAIKIVALDYTHLGYIPADETEAVREWIGNQLPYKCRAHIEESTDYDDRTFLIGTVNISKKDT